MKGSSGSRGGSAGADAVAGADVRLTGLVIVDKDDFM